MYVIENNGIEYNRTIFTSNFHTCLGMCIMYLKNSLDILRNKLYAICL